jgi:hypothetical protein
MCHAFEHEALQTEIRGNQPRVMWSLNVPPACAVSAEVFDLKPTCGRSEGPLESPVLAEVDAGDEFHSFSTQAGNIHRSKRELQQRLPLDQQPQVHL